MAGNLPSRDAPQIKAQFFYSSALPIDDPLSPVPPPPSSSATRSSKLPPRPFSVHDNRALEEAWLKVQNAVSSKQEAVVQELDITRKAPFMEQKPQEGGPDLTLCDDPKHIPFDETMPVGSDEIGNDEFESGFRPYLKSVIPRKASRNIVHHREKAQKPNAKDGTVSLGSSPLERDTTGTPFLRTPSGPRRSRSRSRSRSPSPRTMNISQADSPGDGIEPQELKQSQEMQQAHVVVGISRLHVVEMPNLKMGPIYWDPVHDVSSVVRGTWFYKDTMRPVESDVANQIEEGYEYMKPWTPTYIDELNSCMEIGPEAELKVVHRLWPVDEQPIKGSSPKGKESLTVPIIEHQAAGVLDGFDTPGRLYSKSSIIYANGRDAQILKPSQLPSATGRRKPLGDIRKGRAVGIPVVRGFDVTTWERLNLAKKAIASLKAQETARAMRSSTATSPERPQPSGTCGTSNEALKATDLVLVIHGIGQKLSERVESFHFTHSINSFRRQVNMELEADAVKPWLRQDLGGVMVLPINWRSTLKLEEGGPEPNPNQRDPDPTKNQFSLKDITAESLPAVRNLISDVMLDIPYYLSHHKHNMIEAVVREANRIYRLWCINNPGFHEHGRVHLIAHSLGSVMALDILSKQPTKLPKSLDFKASRVRTDIFEFDTKSLFFCGSPAGFFLLLNKAPLIPRKGRDKPGAEGEDISSKVAGETGTYGCLAVDNIYNVSHYLDPVAYNLNACVDVDYAHSIQPASIPSATATWGQYLGYVFRSKPIVPSKNLTDLEGFPRRPKTATMPSTVELETHNFTKEEIAEKRMFLLNENGQIDYNLLSGGGPFGFEYINMLSAHSSYWTMRDFVRFLVVEIGRLPGKGETLSSIKVMKKPFGRK